MKTNLIVAGILAAASFSANAAPVVYIGGDNNVSSLAHMVNAQAMAAAFDAVAGLGITYDFESATLPSNLTISGGTRTNNSGCGALCGINTTVGGQFFQSLVGGSVTFNFANPVDAFGFYVTGLQTDLVQQQTITYVDGSSVSQVINFPSATGGGGAFVGFIDYGQSVASVTFNATNDILTFDDLRFGNSVNDPNPVPEPTTLALFGLGLMGLASARRRKQ